MLYQSSHNWEAAPHKRVLLFGMSGLGKTFVSNMLRASGDWFHYSVDYRIGTRYMGEFIADSFKRTAMQVPYLRSLLLSDSIYIASNITFDNLAPLSMYLGKPGDADKGGLPFAEYMERQNQHRSAEIAALFDTQHFIKKATDIYQYDHFVCDSGGSICEVVDPSDPNDPVLKALSEVTLLVWIKGDEEHREQLVERFDRAPKPMYYDPAFLKRKWSQYLKENGQNERNVDPDAFVRWTYAEALAHRQPRYEGIAQWGVTISADDVKAVQTVNDFNELISKALADKS